MPVASEDQDNSLAVWLWARHVPSLGLCVLIHRAAVWTGEGGARVASYFLAADSALLGLRLLTVKWVQQKLFLDS